MLFLHPESEQIRSLICRCDWRKGGGIVWIKPKEPNEPLEIFRLLFLDLFSRDLTVFSKKEDARGDCEEFLLVGHKICIFWVQLFRGSLIKKRRYGFIFSSTRHYVIMIGVEKLMKQHWPLRRNG